MSEPRATTMELSAKLVRRIAELSIERQRQFLKNDVLEAVDRQNVIRTADNATMYHRFMKRFFKRADEPMLEREATYEEWKQLYLSGKMDRYHPAYFTFCRARSAWWKRLRQLAEMPLIEGQMIRVSIEDLDLIDYALFLNQVQEEAL